MASSTGPIVTGIDGSDTALAAATWAAAVAVRLGTPLHLVHAYPGEGFFYSEAAATLQAQVTDQLVEDGRTVLKEAADALRAKFPDLTVEGFVGPGPAARALLEAGEHAHLLVVGATGAGALERIMIGSTANGVLRGTKVPVVVWRGDVENPGPDAQPIVVGVDGSDISKSAVLDAFAYADLFGASVVAVHSWLTDTALSMGAATASVLDIEQIERAEQGVVEDSTAEARAQYPNVELKQVTTRGSASAAILANLSDAQLAVVGSHGRGRVAAAILGSTGQNLLHAAPCSVMISRPRD